jgi:hypothetical protein
LSACSRCATAIGPAYYDYYTINKIIESLYRDGRTSSVNDFKRALSERFGINNIRDKSPENFEYSMEDGSLIVNLDYEVRSKLAGKSGFDCAFQEDVWQ